MPVFNLGTSINGDLDIGTNSALRNGASDMTEWIQIGHCDCHSGIDGRSDCLGNGYPWLHVRTPMPADDSASMGWIPYMLEVLGYHSYPHDASHQFQDFKAVVNTTGDGNNTFYSTNVRVNLSNSGSTSIGEPYIYRSNTVYGGYRRMCFAVPKNTCCCTGRLWVRWRIRSSWRTNYAWATQMSPNRTDIVF